MYVRTYLPWYNVIYVMSLTIFWLETYACTTSYAIVAFSWIVDLSTLNTGVWYQYWYWIPIRYHWYCVWGSFLSIDGTTTHGMPYIPNGTRVPFIISMAQCYSRHTYHHGIHSILEYAIQCHDTMVLEYTCTNDTGVPLGTLITLYQYGNRWLPRPGFLS